METFTVEELAKYLKLHEFTIRRLAREGKIPSFKAGGQWRLQIGPSELRVSFARCRVVVYEHLDSSVSIGYGPHTLGYYPPKGLSTYLHNSQKEKVAKRKRAAAVINQKRTHHLLEKADILTI